MTIRRTAFTFATAFLAALAAACGGGSPPTGPGPVAEPPVVQSITPNVGPAAGGTAVTIRGLRFAAGATVTIGGQAATDVVVQDSATITARTPPVPGASSADVVVSVGGRSGTLSGAFSYQVPPNNNPPVISSITAQGLRLNQPPNFADLSESIRITASVRDDETAVDQLEFQWSATAGTFSGTGPSVTWQAPVTAPSTPTQVTLTLKVIERYGTGGIFSQEVTGTRIVALHDSSRELGDMARRFLIEFSKPQTNQDWRDIMRDFSFTAGVCPDLGDVENERQDVIDHYTNYFMHEYSVGAATVSFNFGARCPFRSRKGDGCITVPVRWESTNRSTGVRSSTSGSDYIAAAYSATDRRWWLCSSDYDPTGTLGHPFYSR